MSSAVPARRPYLFFAALPLMAASAVLASFLNCSTTSLGNRRFRSAEPVFSIKDGVARAAYAGREQIRCKLKQVPDVPYLALTKALNAAMRIERLEITAPFKREVYERAMGAADGSGQE
jgi:hypothetical protein